MTVSAVLRTNVLRAPEFSNLTEPLFPSVTWPFTPFPTDGSDGRDNWTRPRGNYFLPLTLIARATDASLEDNRLSKNSSEKV